MSLIDLELEFNASDIALNKRWSDGKRLSKTWAQAKRDLAITIREEKEKFEPKGAVRMGVFYTSGTDIDAPLKAILDAGNKNLYLDDRQVEELFVKVLRDSRPWFNLVAETLCPLEDSLVLRRLCQLRDESV